MLGGTAKVEITPAGSVWMDGMIRAHRSEGVHDPLFARALVLANSENPADAFAITSADICALSTEDNDAVRQSAATLTGIPADHIIIACTHTHSGPATFGHFNPKEDDYVRELIGNLASVIQGAAANLHPAAVGCASGTETTISHYRRLLADDGHVVMNWEPYPPEHIVGPLGVIDPQVGVLKVVPIEKQETTLCLLFNHAGHPNVLSGDNYLISADYPGRAAGLLEEWFTANAIFVNGAQGTMDVDGLKDRDWEGMERIGVALADAVADTAARIVPTSAVSICGASKRYTVPARTITDDEWAWAEDIPQQTGGRVRVLADGVGDDYKALLYREIRECGISDITLQQTCFAIGDCAFISFPGELYTEIGMHIKAESPFAHTYIIGLANGSIGYVPTRKAIGEGGYAEDTRRVDAASEDIIVEQSSALLREVHMLRGGVKP